MAYKSLRIGGLNLSFRAAPSGGGVALSFGGRARGSFVQLVRKWRSRPTTGVDASEPGAMQPGSDSARPAGGPAGPFGDVVWYHSFDFGNGVRVEGQFDHGPILHKYKLPESLAGKRALDVATFDGFWAFEFERRGAQEVVALDLDHPAELAVKFGRGFEIAKQQFNSNVHRVTCSIYDLEPEALGTFDVVHVGDLLLHLNSPVRALQNMARVCTEYALISEVYAPELESQGSGKLLAYMGGHSDVTWWHFSLSALEQMILDAGFSRTELIADFKYGLSGMPENMHHVVFKAYK